MPKKVMVVGGAETLLRGTFGPKFEAHGVSILRHEGKKSGDRLRHRTLPKGCEAVLIIADMCSHTIHEQVVKMVGRDVPIINMPGKWAKAEPVLRVAGILPAAQESKKVDPVQLREIMYDYMLTERKKGRLPHKAEVLAVVQRAFGPGTTVRNSAHTEVHSRVCAALPMPPFIDPPGMVPEEAPPPAPTPKPPTNNPPVAELMEAWTVMAIEERPELVLSEHQGDLVREVFGLTDFYKRSEDDRKEALPFIHQAAAAMQSGWKARPLSKEAREKRNELMLLWVRGLFERFKDTGEWWPDQRRVNASASEIFGVSSPWPKVKAIRAEVMGEWCRDLIGLNLAASHFRRLCSDPTLKLDDLVQDGTVPAVQVTPNKWYTSSFAVQGFLKEHGLLLDAENNPKPKRRPKKSEPGPDFQVVLDKLEAVEARLAAIETRLNEPPAELQTKEPTLADVLSLAKREGVRLILEPLD